MTHYFPLTGQVGLPYGAQPSSVSPFDSSSTSFAPATDPATIFARLQRLGLPSDKTRALETQYQDAFSTAIQSYKLVLPRPQTSTEQTGKTAKEILAAARPALTAVAVLAAGFLIWRAAR
jgi:hypothetical protein